MEIVSINNLRKIYENSCNKCSYSLREKINKFNYLNLSIHFSRDDREFDIHNYKLLKNLFYKKNLSNYKLSKKNKISSGYYKYLFNFKESNYLPNRSFPFLVIIDSLKYSKQLIDVLGIFLIIFFSKVFNIKGKYKKNFFKFENKKIYGITYWIKKKSNSAAYYYPGIKENNKIFISSFADVKSYSKGLLFSLFNSEFITPINVLNLYDLIKSFCQLLHLYFYDIYLVFFKKGFSLLKFWVGWKKGAEIFYSILVYNSLIKISNNSCKCEFITWYENHITNRSFALAVSYSKRNNSSKCILSTFNGTPFNQNISKHILPIRLEHDIGFYGENYYVQDQSSSEELKNYLNKEKINLKVKIVPDSMLRAQPFFKEKLSFKSRNITLFSHASYWDIIACLLAIFNNKTLNDLKYLVEQEKIITIRLHPALNEEDALTEIQSVAEIPKFVNFIFINNSSESFTKSLNLSKYCFFGISSYVNLAIESNANVFLVETSHINKAPIKSNLINSPNLKIIGPW